MAPPKGVGNVPHPFLFNIPLTPCSSALLLLGFLCHYGVCFVLFTAGMRILVMLLLDTLPMLGNVLLLCFFVFFIFGIVGVQLWEGILRQRCVIKLPDNVSPPSYL